MGFKLTRGDYAVAPDLCAALIAMRASYKKIDERVRYIIKTGVSDNDPDKLRCEVELEKTREHMDALQGQIKTAVTQAAHATLTECALLDDVAQASEEIQRRQVTKITKMAERITKECHKLENMSDETDANRAATRSSMNGLAQTLDHTEVDDAAAVPAAVPVDVPAAVPAAVPGTSSTSTACKNKPSDQADLDALAGALGVPPSYPCTKCGAWATTRKSSLTKHMKKCGGAPAKKQKTGDPVFDSPWVQPGAGEADA